MLRTDTVTAQYLSGRKSIALPAQRRKGNGKKLVLRGAAGHNLCGVDLTLELGTLTVVAGVSGSGQVVAHQRHAATHPEQAFLQFAHRAAALRQHRGHREHRQGGDRGPIASRRSPRSNPATHTGSFSPTSATFCGASEAKIRGYKPGRFSFNVAGGAARHARATAIRP